MSLAEAIKQSYNQILQNEGVQIVNTTTNTTFMGLVASGDVEAMFTLVDQDITNTLQITTLTDNRPKTGDRITVYNKTYTVKQITDRVNSPLIRLYVEA